MYGVKFVKSFRGEDIGYARFEGLYLPLLWEQSFCIKSPIALGYTRGHFSALVPTEPYSRIDAARDDSEDVTFLPLMDCEQKLLPIHFLTQNEVSVCVCACVSAGLCLYISRTDYSNQIIINYSFES